MKRLPIVVITLTVLSSIGCNSKSANPATENTVTKTPKNIIFMIGDGMGTEFTTAYRYYADNPATKTVEPTIFDELLVGMASTYPDDHTVVTDSAASATALSSGVKSYNGAIGVNPGKEPVETLLEKAKQLGKQTAIVVTSQINHATPASFIAHNESRKNYDAIADNYLSNRINGKPIADLMLGGGTQYFVREDRNLVEEFQDSGYQYSNNLKQLQSIDALPALGLFAPINLPYIVDKKDHSHHLITMTQHALALLSKKNDNGFFMMIEGSLIDWCGHANDIACAMNEMSDFAATLSAVKRFAQADGETLVVVTADHNTGGLSIGSFDEYLWKPALIKQIHTSVEKLTGVLMNSNNMLASWNEYIDFELTKDEAEQIYKAKQKSAKAMNNTLLNIINRRTFTGWTSHGHTAGDVQIFAYGIGAEKFRGHLDNTDIAKQLFTFFNQTK